VEAIDLGVGFAERAGALGFELEAGEVETLGRYLGLLMAANRVMNLTAIRTVEEGVEKHLLDSLTLIPVLAEAQAGGDEGDGPSATLRVLDVGSGGGLPGVVLAICRPDASVTLLDSTEKKCGFLRHAARELGLENVTVWHDRAEIAGQDRANKREKFDVVTARAVGRLASLLEITVPFARVGGLCVLTKGQKAEEELAEAKKALHLLHAAHAGTVETPTGRIVVIEKLRKTPAAYPREIGEPKRNPLGVESDSR
jgi:16S rRNA (guanine527-N7)-methyltransferase